MDTGQHTIAVGYDGSEHAERAVLWAAEEAARRSAALRVLTVVDDDGLGIRGPVGMAHWWTEVATEGARRTADRGVALALASHPDLRATGVGHAGLPAAALIEASRRAALLVVGTRGRSPLAELTLGSVAERVAAHGSCPVVVVHRDVGAIPGPRRPVVVGIDGSTSALAALDVAARWAAGAHAELHVVRAWTAGDVWAYDGLTATELQRLTQHAEETARRTTDGAVTHALELHPDLRVRGVTVPGNPAVALAERAGDAGVLVVGSRGLGAFTALVLGSVSHALVRTAPCAVTVVGERVPPWSRSAAPRADAEGTPRR